MKKIILTIALTFITTFAFSTTYKTINFNTDNVPVHEYESIENVDYWVSLFNFINEADTTTEDKIVIKYDGKWKYVIPSSEAFIQLEIIMSHLTSGTNIKDGSFSASMKKVFDIAKKDKLIVTIR